MCRLCEGASWEEVVAENATAIAVYGYILQGVTDDDHAPWVYTVGLLDAVDHPEMIVAGLSVETSAHVLAELADAALEGRRYDVGDCARTRRGTVRIGAVHPIQYGLDTFNNWHELRAAGVIHAPELAAVQVVFGHSFFCAEHQAAQPLLSDPRARVGELLTPPNRAARRRRRRRT